MQSSESIYELFVQATRDRLDELESIYELAVQAARERVDELAFCRSLKDNSILKRRHEQAIAELTALGRGYNQMIIDIYKELFKDGT